MLGVLKSRGVLIFIGLVLVALLLWFAGPYFAFADHKPLESTTARLIAILVLVVIWVVVLQIKLMRSNNASKKIAEGVAQGGADGEASDGKGSGVDAAQ